MCTISLKTEENVIRFSNFCCTESKLLQNKSKNNYDLGTSKPSTIKVFNGYSSLLSNILYYLYLNLSNKVITQFPLGL